MSELKQTDLSKRLRLTLERGIDSNGMRTLLLKAADEIDRYYTGMLNWKATAEAQNAQPEATKPAQDLGAAILALPCLGTMSQFATIGDLQLYQQGHKEALEAAAALASPADALVAGDRVDTELLRKLRDYIDQKSKEYGYGFYRPANPHDFTPDADQCSDDEIAAHKAACEAYDKGEYTHDHSGCSHEGSMHILYAPWGIGSYVIRDDEAEELIAAIDAVRQSTPTTDAPQAKGSEVNDEPK